MVNRDALPPVNGGLFCGFLNASLGEGVSGSAA